MKGSRMKRHMKNPSAASNRIEDINRKIEELKAERAALTEYLEDQQNLITFTLRDLAAFSS
jgi:predicted RNase H-like nuclease (RuvC/YqgF family)